MPSRFIHLHVHSHYSLLDGLSKVPDLVKRAKELRMDAIALTDHGVMYGAIEFYKECRHAGIKPIIGMEVYIAPRKLTDKKPGIDAKNNHLLLLAQNEIGYKNLIKLTSKAHIEGFYYRPRIDNEYLNEHAEGLIGASACLKGKIPQLLLENRYSEARETALFYERIFGKGNFYLELEHHPEIQEQNKINKLLIKLSQDAKLPLILTKDSHYLYPDDKEAQDALVCIQTGKTMDDKKRLNMTGFDTSLVNENVMLEYARELNCPEAIENTRKIADECKIELDLTTWHFPKFAVPNSRPSDEYIRELTYSGLKKKEGQITPDDKQRLDYELDIIISKKYHDYFLIVADFMKWAHDQGIIATTRGSASGSLVSYALGITSVNPLHFQLPFERFLTKKRPTPPDIDCDIQDSRRGEVIEYVRNKYGKRQVANIGTFGTMKARAAVRDITRVLGLPYAMGDKIAKMIPQGPQGSYISIEKAIEINPELKQFYESDAHVKKIMNLAKKIERCVRHVSVHAAGVVIAPDKLTNFLPLQIEPKGEEIITQYDMHAIDPNIEEETVGLLKADFLGIRNLSILGIAKEIVKHTKKIEIDLEKIPWDDKKTFKLLSHGRTMGVFQLSSSGMTRYLKELIPDNIYDIMAMVALYRPGPMEIIPEYIRRKKDPSSITYPHPKLKDILERTYGLLIYQDDVMLTAMTLAGYEAEEADEFRKAMGKKIKSLMVKQKIKFIEGCKKNGLENSKAQEIWSYIEPFAGYGFNKAHSSSYAVVAYQTAYMKANYPSEFMAALMTAESDNTGKIVEAVAECEKMSIDVLAPNINESLANFTYISDKAIRFGLKAIKNLGTDIVDTIISERKNGGIYISLEDFLIRVHSKNLNKKSLEALIKSGAMDAFGERNQMISNMNRLLAFIKTYERERNTGQFSLFGAKAEKKIVLTLDPTEAAEEKQKLIWEKEMLGLYVSSHPFKNISGIFAKVTANCRDVLDKQITAGSNIYSAGIITNIKKIFTKKNELMMFVTLEDATSALEVIVFPKLLKKNPEIWQEDKFVFLSGKISDKDDIPKILADRAYEIDPNNPQSVLKKINHHVDNGESQDKTTARDIFISVDAKNFNKKMHTDLKIIFERNYGKNRVYLMVQQNGEIRKIVTNFYISYNNEVQRQIEELIGERNIRIKMRNNLPIYKQ
ncbi:DNA polymerase III subunit alpha [Candidatus Kuenenbacteria bacterium CG1_02_38_13]|uniref:DNA-directed DNA polymerase n=1 Tax=Candidatus Kuenenbacteria bacterium CG1_02_38_13 TaxID=1805235 RepID=A0A1J4U1Y7_9BACT|nr:MAG: DNA polymerase III subunit alpha [Candidatus Kuenenbacteria bacterium CG1_02_38_13]